MYDSWDFLHFREAPQTFWFPSSAYQIMLLTPAVRGTYLAHIPAISVTPGERDRCRCAAVCIGG